MKLEDYLEFFSSNQIRVRGHRIGVEHIVERFQQGLQPEEVQRSFPGLSLEQIYAIITYYLRNKDDVDAYMMRLREGLDDEIRILQDRERPGVIERLRCMQASQQRAHSTV